MNIIFLGAPGSGKGTQAAMLSSELKIPAISTGDALRHEVGIKSEIGNLAKSYMDAGDLVPDEVVVNIIKNRIIQEDCENGFILDGFPRNVSQATELETMINSVDKKIEFVFNFKVDEEVLVKRIAGRFSCKGCGTVYNRYFKKPEKEGICDKCGSSDFLNRADDNEATVKNRLKVYNDSTFALIEFYQKKNLLIELDAVKSAPLIFKELVEIITKS